MTQSMINEAHAAAAAEHSVTVIPAGAAFEIFETQSCSNPAAVSLRAADGEHPRCTLAAAPLQPLLSHLCCSAAGTYLTSCCVFEALTSQSVLGNGYRMPGMSDEEASSLQQCAHYAKL